MIILTEQFIIFHLVFVWAMFILCKDNWLPRKFEEYANRYHCENKWRYWFLIGLSECDFCRNNWFSLPIIIPLALYFNDYYILTWGILSSSISAQLNR